MAKLRIEIGGNLDIDGYVSVVERLIQDPAAFKKYQKRPAKRPKLLQDAANGNGGNHPITQLTTTGQTEQITKDNCFIIGDQDELRDGNDPDSTSRVTVPMPVDAMPASIANPDPFDYLDRYVQAILSLYMKPVNPPTNPPSYIFNSAPNQEKARKFMFGVMLLTRCR